MEENMLTARAEYAKCPTCGVNQEWYWRNFDQYGEKFFGFYTTCKHCRQIHIFHNKELVFPRILPLSIKPHEGFNNFPKGKKLFEESLAVSLDSPRAALTLARMCLESTVNDILISQKEPVNDIFKANIDKLMELGLIRKSLKEILTESRTIGNKATHNFNLIDTENEITQEDCFCVWKAINYLMESLAQEEQIIADLKEIKGKVTKQS